MEVEIKTVIEVNAQSLVESIPVVELGEFLSIAAEKLNDDNTRRNDAAGKFAEGLSENGCRFLAEVITQHYIRNRVTS